GPFYGMAARDGGFQCFGIVECRPNRHTRRGDDIAPAKVHQQPSPALALLWPECPTKQMLAMLGQPHSLRAAFSHQYGLNSWPGKQLQLPRPGSAAIYDAHKRTQSALCRIRERTIMATEMTTAPKLETAPASDVAERPLQYLDKAVNAIRDLGIWPESQGEQPITGLLSQITELDETRVILIGRTLSQASAFNEVVREQVAAMKIGERYEDITKGFDSIRDDAKVMVDQLADNKIDLFERASNVWMKISRGDIATRFNKIRDIYLDVTKDTKDQIEIGRASWRE